MPITDLEKYRVIDNVNSYYRLTSESKRELLLNKYPNAAAAYSLRLLDGYYRGPLVRVRRDDDGAEVDVYPDYNNELSLDSLVSNVPDAEDTTTDPDENADATFLKSLESLGEFVSNPNYVDNGTAVNATVCVWYDQANGDNGNDAIQVVATSQPLIVSGGVLVTENGKPAIEGDGTGGKHLTTSNTTLSGDLAVIAVCSFDTSNNDSMIFGGTATATKGYLWRQFATTLNWKNDSESGFNNFTVSLLAANNLIFGNRAGTDVSMSVNGSNNTVTENATQGLSFTINRIGGGYTNQYSLDGTYQEIIFYNSDQSTNRTGIEEDINNHYQIEGFESPQPLLDEFGGAAAAYSLRLLSSTYSGPLVRIRRDIDDIEVDVYPDDNGEFSKYSTIQDGGAELTTGVTGGTTDKTTLHEFLYGVETNCFVVRWYDQSSDNPANGNHATQDIETAQPKIYDSATGLITENGKPAVEFDGSSDYIDAAVSITDDFTTLAVATTTDTSTNAKLLLDETNAKSYLYVASAEFNWYDGAAVSKIADADTTQNLFYISANATNSVAAIDGVDQSVTGINNAGFGSLRIGGRVGTPQYWTGNAQEFIFYASDKRTDRTGIESNINTHYNIY